MENTKLSLIWDPKSPTLQFVNEEDFQMKDLLGRLGLETSPLKDSLGSVDRSEIISRQELVRLLWEDQRLLSWCLTDKNMFLGSNDLSTTNPDNFLKAFNPKNPSSPYLASIRMTKAMFKRSVAQVGVKLEGKLKKFLDFLEDTFEDAKRLERQYADAVYPELEQQARYHGFARFSFKFGEGEVSLSNQEAVGWNQYSYRLSSDYHIFRFPFQDRKFLNFVAKFLGWTIFLPVTLGLHWRNYEMEKRRFAPLLKTDLPDEMVKDVRDYVQDFIRDIRKRHAERVSLGYEVYKRLLDKEVELSVAVKYGEEGLRVRLVNHSVVKVDHGRALGLTNDVEKFFEKYDHTGQYVGAFKTKVEKLSSEMYKRTNTRLYDLDLEKLLTNLIVSCRPETLKDGVIISDVGSKEMLRREALSVIVEAKPEIKRMRDDIIKYRSLVNQILGNIHQVADLVCVMKSAAGKIKKPVCFPKIYNDEQHLVEFNKLYPVHLIGRKNNVGKVVTGRKLVPINQLIPINGQMVALTGQNAGGKTATEVELINSIFLAQSGLPVFAESFGLNPKRVIGMVFVERGAGSLLQLLLKKTKNILDATEAQRENHIFVVIDELLTGTQEASGLAIGKKVLAKLASSGASVIFSTQITGLAEYAVENLNARAFAFDINHQVKPGIDSGNPELLMKELGMEELLS